MWHLLCIAELAVVQEPVARHKAKEERSRAKRVEKKTWQLRELLGECLGTLGKVATQGTPWGVPRRFRYGVLMAAGRSK